MMSLLPLRVGSRAVYVLDIILMLQIQRYRAGLQRKYMVQNIKYKAANQERHKKRSL